MKKMLFLYSTLLLVTMGCSKSGNENDLAGVWKEKSIINKFAGTSYWVRLNADKTFELKLHLFTDMIDIEPKPCPDNRTDYVKGTYQLNGKRIYFDGLYCDASFERAQPNCKGTLVFQSAYSMTFTGKDLVLDFDKDDYRKIWLIKQ